MTISFDNLRPDDAERFVAMARRAYGGATSVAAGRPRAPDSQMLVAREDGVPVATTGWYDMGQFLGGRRVPCGGVTAVMVEPPHRGRGIARELLGLVFAEMVDAGLAMTSLFPTSGRLYRSMGYEMAGIHARSRVRLDQLPTDRPGLGEIFVETTWEDPALRSVYTSMARRHDGWLDRPDVVWAQGAHDASTTSRPSSLFALRRDDETVGWIAYDYGDSAEALFSVDIRHAFATDTAGLRRLLALVASTSTTADTATTLLPLPVLALCVEHAQRISRVSDWTWMSRLLDAPGAVSARGWPPGLTVEVPLVLRDPHLARNDGAWMLEVRDGEANLEPVDADRADAMEMGIGTFSALFTGWADPFVLAAAGAVSGETERRLAGLQAAFAGPQPTLVDFF